MTTTCNPDDSRTRIILDVRSLRSRIAELNDALGHCSPQLFGSQWWLDRLEAAAAAKRQLDRLEWLLEG